MPIELGLDDAVVRVKLPDLPVIQAQLPRDPTVRVIAVAAPANLAEVQERIDLAVAEVQSQVADALEEHIESPEPHPAYDDMHSFRLIFENHLI